jgi:hypothetical protein
LEWLATEDVHDVLMQWRELLGMKGWLGELPTQLAVYDELSTEQLRRGATARELLYDRRLLETRDRLTRNIAAFAGRIDTLTGTTPSPDATWMVMLANDEERAVIEKLAGMRRVAVGHLSERARDKWLNRVERLEGVLFWQLVNASSTRARLLEKKFAAIQADLADVNTRIARVQSAEQQFVAGIQTDIGAFAKRADAITLRVDDALRGREESLAIQIRRGMQREMREVNKYLLVARIAIARATDLLAQGGDPSAGARRSGVGR